MEDRSNTENKIDIEKRKYDKWHNLVSHGNVKEVRQFLIEFG